MTKFHHQAALLVAAALAQTAASAAVPLTNNTLYVCEYKSNGNLYKLSASTAAATLVGPTQISPSCTDLAFRNSTLFGTTFSRLIVLNPTTGKATFRGSFGSGISDINALVTQPSTNRLYGAGSVAPGRFVQIDPVTGVATNRGFFGAGLGSAGDLAFLDGILYATLTNSASPNGTWLARISLSSSTIGKATLIGRIRRISGASTIYLRDVYGLSVRNGVLFGAMRTGELLRINPNTAVATLVGDNNKVQGGMTTSPP